MVIHGYMYFSPIEKCLTSLFLMDLLCISCEGVLQLSKLLMSNSKQHHDVILIFAIIFVYNLYMFERFLILADADMCDSQEIVDLQIVGVVVQPALQYIDGLVHLLVLVVLLCALEELCEIAGL
jgi:hypothetical protein